MTRTACGVIALAALLLGGPAAAAVQAGVSAAVRGQVDLLPIVEKVKRQVESGEDVFLGDEISSFDDSGMQIMLLDETVFTIGPNTDLTVDEFVYDPATGAGQVTASLAKGVLRFVTGKVAEASPQNTVINLPVGTIGIRGTFGAALYDSELGRALVVLLGPGLDNNADARVGRLGVTAGGVTVELVRTRFGTIIEPGQPPSPPFELSDAQLASILSGLAPKPVGAPEKPPSAGAASTDAGEDTAQALEPIGSTTLTDENLDDQGETGSQSATTGTSVIDIAFFDQLRTIPSGDFIFNILNPQNSSAVAPFLQTLKNGSSVSILGHFHAQLEISFGSRTIGGGTSSIFVDTVINSSGNISAGTSISATSYDNLSGPAALLLNVASNFTAATVLVNSDGIIANQAAIGVIFDDGSNQGIGAALSDPRTSSGP